jgi:opacity protein-like surface antigen
MKKLLYLIVITSALTSYSQDWRYGVKLGGNLGMTTVEFPDTKNLGTGFQVGFQLEYEKTTQYSIQPELLFSAQSSVSNVNLSYLSNPLAGTVSSFNARYEYQFQMLQLPVMIKMYIDDTSKGFIEFGPQLSYLLAADVTYRYEASDRTDGVTVITDSNAGKIDYLDYLNSLSFQLNVGAGYNLNKNWFANARFVLGMGSLYKKSDEGIAGLPSINASLRNHAFQLGLGYRF